MEFLSNELCLSGFSLVFYTVQQLFMIMDQVNWAIAGTI